MTAEDIGLILNIISAPLTAAFIVVTLRAVSAAERDDIGKALVMYPLACAIASVTFIVMIIYIIYVLITS